MLLLRIIVARRWLILGILVGVIVLLLPPPAGLSPAGMSALALLATTVIFLVTEAIPLPAVALLIAIGEVALGLGTPNEIARSFMSDAVFFIMGSLMISVALVKQKLEVRIAWGLLRLTGPRVEWIVFGLMATAALLTSFIGQHTVAAMMLPVVLGIIQAVECDRPKAQNLATLLLMSLAYGSAFASAATPSGGARNPIMIDYWRQMFDLHMDYLSWMAYAYPVMLLHLPFLTFMLLKTFGPEERLLTRALVRLRREVHAKGRISSRDLGAIGIFIVILISWVTLGGRVGLGIIALLGALIYLVSGLVRWEDLNSGVNWGVVWLYAATISLGFQLQTSGAALWLAERLLGLLGNVKGPALFLAMSLLTILFGDLMGGGIAVAVVGPLTLHMAQLSGESLISTGFVTALSSAFTYHTVIGAPSSMIVYGSGMLRPRDFLRAGSKLLAVSIIILLVIAVFYWPWLNHVKGVR